jgi:hypothetical protein
MSDAVASPVLIRKVGVLLRDLRAADLEAAAAGLVDQLPRLVARRIDEGRAAGAAARLRFGARASISAIRRADRELVARRRAQPRRGEDPVGRRVAVAVAEAHLGRARLVQAAGPVDRLTEISTWTISPS